MQLAHATWAEVQTYLELCPGIILPTGSIEQHGPMGLIGTDAICAELIATGAGERIKALVAPVLAYTPAPFNTAFPGTMSISEPLFEQLATEIFAGLQAQGFGRIYVLNAHGANLAPLKRAADTRTNGEIRIRSWWDFETVNALRQAYYGDWEGMHATPSEIAITQSALRTILSPDAALPPEKLSPEYIAAHAGDRHGPPDAHRATFPDGRVGSHSALARPEHGHRLREAAERAVAADFQRFCT